jgi:hypothetical protein
MTAVDVATAAGYILIGAGGDAQLVRRAHPDDLAGL